MRRLPTGNCLLVHAPLTRRPDAAAGRGRRIADRFPGGVSAAAARRQILVHSVVDPEGGMGRERERPSFNASKKIYTRHTKQQEVELPQR